MVVKRQSVLSDSYLEEWNNLIINTKIYGNFDDNGKMMFNWFRDYIEDEKDNRILGVKFYPGAGKTFVIAQITTMLKPEVPYIYFTKTHDIINEFLGYQVKSENGNIAVHLKGKLDSCKKLDSKGARILEKYGTNTWYCKICSHRDECEYQTTMAQILMSEPTISWAGHFMEYFVFYEKILKKKNIHDKYLLIFDEDFIDSLFCKERITSQHIAEILKNKPKSAKTTLFWSNLLSEIVKKLSASKREEILPIEKAVEDIFIQFHKLYTIDELESEEKHYDTIIQNNFDTDDELEFRNPYTTLIEIHKFFTRYQGTPRGFIDMGYSGYLDVNYFRYIDVYDNCIVLNATFESEIFYNFFPQGVKDRNLFDLKIIDGNFNRNQNVYQIEGKEGKVNYRRFTKVTILKDKQLSVIGDRNLHWTLFFAGKHEHTLVGAKDETIAAIGDNEEVQRLVLDKVAILCDQKTRKKYYKENPEGNFIKYCANFKIVFMNFSRGAGIDSFGHFDGCVIFQEFIPHKLKQEKNEMMLYQIDPTVLFRNADQNVMYQFINRCRPLAFMRKNGIPFLDKWGDWAQHDFDLLIIPSTDLGLKFTKGHKGIQRFIPTSFYSVLDKNHITDNGKQIIEFMKSKPNCTRVEIRMGTKLNYNTLVLELKRLSISGLITALLNNKNEYLYHLQ